MDGITAVYGVLSGFVPLTAIVVADDMISDDVLPQNKGVSVNRRGVIQLELVSSVDGRTAAYGETVFVRQRIRIRIHAIDAATRSAIRRQVRRALFANEFPTVEGLSNVVIHTDGEGPDGTAPESSVRIGLQDVIVTFNEAR